MIWTIFRWGIRIGFVATFFYIGTGDPNSLFAKAIGWSFFGWVVVRAAPGMWRDVKTLWYLGKRYGRTGMAAMGWKPNQVM